jgi:hypothetical protein
MKFSVFLTAILAVASTAFAQTPRNYTTADLGLSAGSGFTGALSYNKFYGVGKSGKFKVGWGLRFNTHFADQNDYRTAPAKLTSGKSSIVALFSEDIVGQIDTLRLSSPQVNSLNLSIHLQYALLKKLEVGFNIDALGFSFGGQQRGQFIARQSDATGRSNNGNSSITAKPTTLNALLISDSDIGSLNSELYARYWLTDKWAVRAGLSFEFWEYTTTQKLAFDNDRFRNKILLPLVAVSYRFR